MSFARWEANIARDPTIGTWRRSGGVFFMCNRQDKTKKGRKTSEKIKTQLLGTEKIYKGHLSLSVRTSFTAVSPLTHLWTVFLLKPEYLEERKREKSRCLACRGA